MHHHPAPTAPRCLPCNYTVDVSLLPMKMASGCPCTPALMCSVVHGYKDLFSPRSCGIPRSAWLPLRLVHPPQHSESPFYYDITLEY